MKKKRYALGALGMLGRLARRVENVSVGYAGAQISIGLQGGGAARPAVLRRGLKPEDKTPFYEMEPERLRSWYPAYDGGWEANYRLLYADLLALHQDDTRPLRLEALRVDRIEMTCEPIGWRLPDALRDHGKRMVAHFRDTGRLLPADTPEGYENNHALRLCAFDAATGAMVVQGARYDQQVATNLSLDTATGGIEAEGETIRMGYEAPVDGRLPPLSASRLANTLGVAAMLYTPDGRALWRVRRGDMGSIAQERLHCTVSGVCEVPRPLPDRAGFDLIRAGMALEMEAETGLRPDQYDLYPVAFARELPRGGKPQVFFAAIARVPLEEIEAASRAAIEGREFIRNVVHAFLEANPEEDPVERFTYEGWAAGRLAEMFLEANPQLLPDRPD